MDRLLFPLKGLTVSVPKPGEEIGEQSDLAINVGCRSRSAFSMILWPVVHTKPYHLQFFDGLPTILHIHSRPTSNRLFL
jgi:hypothetical protein